jgi:HEAT repeat protein
VAQKTGVGVVLVLAVIVGGIVVFWLNQPVGNSQDPGDDYQLLDRTETMIQQAAGKALGDQNIHTATLPSRIFAATAGGYMSHLSRFSAGTPAIFTEFYDADVAVRPVPSGEVPFLLQFANREHPNRLPADLRDRIPDTLPEADRALMFYVLFDISEPDVIRIEAMNILRWTKDPDLEAGLIALLDRADENRRMRAYLAQNLGMSWSDHSQHPENLKWEAVLEMLTTDPEDGAAREALLAILDTGGEVGMDHLRSWQEPENERFRDLLVHALGGTQWYEQTDALVKTLTNSTERTATRSAAAVVLAQWDQGSAVAPLEIMVDNKSEDPALRRVAGFALRRLSDSQ